MEIVAATLTNFGRRLYAARKDALSGYEMGEWAEDNSLLTWPGGSDRKYFWGLTPEEYRVCTEFESETGVELETISVGRVTFTVPDADRVVKLPRWGTSALMGDGWERNQSEVSLSSELGSDCLLRVSDADTEGWWVTMPATYRPSEDGDIESGVVAELRDSLTGTPIRGTRVSWESVGRRNGTWYVVDYF